jgi:molybdopterin biosynthesis enzyme
MRDDRTEGLQKIAQFTSMADALARISAPLKPVSAQTLEISEALGYTLAQDVDIDVCMPPAAVALRDGWAVRSELTTDASPYAPTPVPGATWIETGSALASEHDAVLPIEAAIARAGVVQAVAAATPGEGILPASADVPPDDHTLWAGRRINCLQAALLQKAHIESVQVRIPRLRLARARGDADWVFDTALECIAEAIRCNGAVVTGETSNELEELFGEQTSDAFVLIGGSGCGRRDRVVRMLASMGELVTHGIALVPGETSAFGFTKNSRPVLVLPGRLDAAFAAWHVLGRALLQKLAGNTEPLVTATATLTQKVTSAGGIAELVPVHCDGFTATPLGSGYLPAVILARANGWIFIGPESEGYPAGTVVAIRPWP